MINPKCDKCGEELAAYGALAFSPPDTRPDQSCGREVNKYHICTKCWDLILAWKPSPADRKESPPRNPTSFSLKTARIDDLGALVTTYEGKHSQGSRGGNTLTFEIELRLDVKLQPGRITITKVNFGELDSPSPEEAFAKMGEWMARGAAALANAVESMQASGAGGKAKIASLPIFLPV
jgi:hypothetical protein